MFEGEKDIPESTPLYKYLSVEAFLYLIEFERLTFSQTTNWLDAFEGSGYEFFKKATKDHQLANKDDFYGSYWSLQSEEKSLYEDVKEYELAIEELESEGSASMWESYCRNGGVRIKTMVGKINNLLSDYLEGFNIYRGRVFYEPASSWKKTKESYRNRDVVLTFSLKRIFSRYASEYRYIIVPNKHIEENIVLVPINNILYDFIDEILVSSATTSNKWISRTLYNIGIRIPPPSSGLNSAKNEKTILQNITAIRTNITSVRTSGYGF